MTLEFSEGRKGMMAVQYQRRAAARPASTRRRLGRTLVVTAALTALAAAVPGALSTGAGAAGTSDTEASGPTAVARQLVATLHRASTAGLCSLALPSQRHTCRTESSYIQGHWSTKGIALGRIV